MPCLVSFSVRSQTLCKTVRSQFSPLSRRVLEVIVAVHWKNWGKLCQINWKRSPESRHKSPPSRKLLRQVSVCPLAGEVSPLSPDELFPTPLSLPWTPRPPRPTNLLNLTKNAKPQQFNSSSHGSRGRRVFRRFCDWIISSASELYWPANW